MVGTVKGFTETLLVTVIKTRWRHAGEPTNDSSQRRCLVRYGFDFVRSRRLMTRFDNVIGILIFRDRF